MLALQGGIGDGVIPSAISLPLSPEEMGDTAGRRLQSRTIRSVRLGELTVKYGVGTDRAGNRIIPGELRLIAPPGNNFAYDTILFVTVMRYVRLMQREEIQRRILKEHSFHISTGSVSQLSLEGLAYLEKCHFAAAERLAALYRRKCFFIHLDGTNEGGEYTHFVVRDGMSRNVIYSEKIPSEGEDSIVPVLEKVKFLFGIPSAVVSDMSEAIKNAVAKVFRGVPHRLCHFHFLKAIGKDLLTEHHHRMCISVKRMKTTLCEIRKKTKDEQAALHCGRTGRRRKGHYDCGWLLSAIDRINDSGRDLGAEGFPFDLSALAFHERCAQVFEALEQIMDGGVRPEAACFCFLRNRLQEFLQWEKGDVAQIKTLNGIFNELRDILHPKTEGERIPLNWGMQGGDIRASEMEPELERLRIRAEKKIKSKGLTKYLLKAWKIVASRLKKQQGMLDPSITLGNETVILPRTNNLSETGFRDAKRKARRTTGKKNLSKHMDELPAQYFYTFNLDDPEYVKTVYGDGEIFDSFHLVDRKEVKKNVENMKAQRKAPNSVDYKLIRSKDYFEQLVRYFSAGHRDVRQEKVA